MHDERCAADRGAFNTLIFNRCARGFTLLAPCSYLNKSDGPTFAFDRVEDLAKWLIDQYGEHPVQILIDTGQAGHPEDGDGIVRDANGRPAKISIPGATPRE